MERLGLVAPGSLVLADNVLIPGAPDFLAHVGAATGPGSGSSFAVPSSSMFKGGSKGSRRSSGSSSGADDSVGSSGLAWSTELLETAYEVEERYKVDWQPRRDAMSISRCLAAPPEAA
jgi:hypothetical protein